MARLNLVDVKQSGSTGNCYITLACNGSFTDAHVPYGEAVTGEVKAGTDCTSRILISTGGAHLTKCQ